MQKVEVQDTYSGLVLYDVDSNRLTVVLNDSNSLATFPSLVAGRADAVLCRRFFPAVRQGPVGGDGHEIPRLEI
ncbi:hypothetical protein NXX53_20960 [Bacteroides salyersiae]|nr:hypothetical protein [Bacteroides salyersiae]